MYVGSVFVFVVVFEVVYFWDDLCDVCKVLYYLEWFFNVYIVYSKVKVLR